MRKYMLCAHTRCNRFVLCKCGRMLCRISGDRCFVFAHYIKEDGERMCIECYEREHADIMDKI